METCKLLYNTSIVLIYVTAGKCKIQTYKGCSWKGIVLKQVVFSNKGCFQKGASSIK